MPVSLFKKEMRTKDANDRVVIAPGTLRKIGKKFGRLGGDEISVVKNSLDIFHPSQDPGAQRAAPVNRLRGSQTMISGIGRRDELLVERIEQTLRILLCNFVGQC